MVGPVGLAESLTKSRVPCLWHESNGRVQKMLFV
jgi:hypothetical protein